MFPFAFGGLLAFAFGQALFQPEVGPAFVPLFAAFLVGAVGVVVLGVGGPAGPVHGPLAAGDFVGGFFGEGRQLQCGGECVFDHHVDFGRSAVQSGFVVIRC